MKHKKVNIPMMPNTAKQIALEMHAAATTVVLAPSSDSATEIAKRLAIISAAWDAQSKKPIRLRKDSLSLALIAALDSVVSMQEREQRTGTWGVSGDEAKAIRDAAARFDECLKRIPFQAYEAARIYIEQALAD